jgi:hypothetical protein
MKYNSIEAFVPSGADFQASKQLFSALGFNIVWENGDYAGFENNGCKFILQNYTDKHFAENLMINVKVDNLDEFYKEVTEKNLTATFNIKLGEPKNFPWGREVNLIDLAGVCWHFTQG